MSHSTTRFSSSSSSSCSRLVQRGGNVKVAYKAGYIPANRSFFVEKPDRRSRAVHHLISDHEVDREDKKKVIVLLDKEMRSTLLCYACLLLVGVQAIGKYRGLEFLEPCSRNDQKIEGCLARTANILVERFRQGELFWNKIRSHFCII